MEAWRRALRADLAQVALNCGDECALIEAIQALAAAVDDIHTLAAVIRILKDADPDPAETGEAREASRG